MKFEEIKEQLEKYREQGKKPFVTSSFQTHSIPLLHILSRIDNTIPVYFLNTGFLFPETLTYKDQIAELLQMDVKGLTSSTPKHMQRNSSGNFYFTDDPDYCCYLNKTAPLEPVLIEYDIWINGIRADQNANRARMKVEQPSQHNTMRFHPVLDWSNKDIYDYIREYNLPKHPLDTQGYLSIGCEPCTRKFDVENNRDGRWFGLNKTECGLHTDLVKND